MAELSFGYDPLAMVAQLAAGMTPGWRHTGPTGCHTAAACLMGAEGRITAMHGMDMLSDDPSVFFFKLVSRVGDVMLRPPHGNSIVGFLGVTAPSEDAAIAALSAKNVLLHVQVEEAIHAA